MTDLFFNPLQDGYCENPYPHLADLRENLPVHQTLTGAWAVFRQADVSTLLRNPALSVDSSEIDAADSARVQLITEVLGERPERSTSILNVDPPDHTRLRRLVAKAFTPRSIEQLRPMIQGLVDKQLDAMEAAESPDVVDGLAFPLPFDVITEMLGMPPGDTEELRGWGEALVKTLDPIIDDEILRTAVRASANMDAHIDEVIEWKRANPGDDLLTALIEAEEDGDRLSPVELRDQVTLLFIAGHETTVNLIGTGIYELLRHPDQSELLRSDTSLDVPAIDELLRFVSPVQFSRRISVAEITFGDQIIPRKAVVLAGLAAANRDPEFWGETADELDITRPNASQHMSFGSGVHYCLGASLAKLEAQLAIGTFIRRFPNAAPDGAPTWNGRINLRGLEKFPVTLS